MQFATKSITITLGVGILASVVSAANIAGTVKGPDGAAFMGAFVVAENTKNRITVSVLSDKQGGYHIDNLPAATYSVRIRAIGYKSDPHNDVQLSEKQNVSFNFALQKGTVRWSDLTMYQGMQLLPNAKGRDDLFASCFICHAFQTRMASTVRDEDGWRDRVNYMRNGVGVGINHGGYPNPNVPVPDPKVPDEEKFNNIVSYLTLAFGPASPKTASPADMPEYKATVRPYSEQAMNIVYVEYDVTSPDGRGLPWSAAPDKDGNFWMPYYGNGNKVGRLNPKTGEVTFYNLPFDLPSAGVHSVIPVPDGTVWFTEFDLNKIVHLDPATKELTEIPDPLPDGKRTAHHTIRVDADGNLWTSGGPVISRYNPVTKQFTHYDAPGTYANVVGKDGVEWFTTFTNNGPIVRVTRDGEMSKFYPPTKGRPQRLALDTDGMVYFTERRGNKVGRFDTKTEMFKEYDLPGPSPSPYAVNVDKDHNVWYASSEQDEIGKLDPKTGNVLEYPFPHSEAYIREFFIDQQGRFWFATPANNRVGYFYLAGLAQGTSK